jgi:serine/threonine protein kinase/class 3 adenylate cyclase
MAPTDISLSSSTVLEMAHVLFLDIVGFSLKPMSEERQMLRDLQKMVMATAEFARAHQKNQLISLPTGDGMALVFFGDLEAPVRCAMELSRTLAKGAPQIGLRMGVHTGPVYRVADINFNSNVAGGGINMAQRVMDCGDAGHILLSGTVTELLLQVGNWSENLHDLGEVRVKHGQKIRMWNLYGEGFGNPKTPAKVKAESSIHVKEDPPAPAKIKANIPEVERPPAPSLREPSREPSREPQRDSPREPHRDPMLNRDISHYRILRRLGGGETGAVYEAADQSLARRVALKFLPEDHSSSASSLERFKKEVRAASLLNHPNICIVHDAGDFEGRYFVVMELLEGETLKHLIARKRLSAEEIVQHGVQIADALNCAHAQGVIHRDIKPANIFLTEGKRVKVRDFGLASFAFAQPDLAETGQAGAQFAGAQTVGAQFAGANNSAHIAESICCMSPEQARGLELDHRTDLFSFGSVLYEMATGVHPFRGNTSAATFDAILNREPAAPASLNPKIPPGLEAIIGKALAKDRSLRYQSAMEMRTLLERSLSVPRAAPPAVAPAPAAPAPPPAAPVIAPTVPAVSTASNAPKPGEVALLYKRNSPADEQVLRLLEEELRRSGYPVFVDRHLQVGMEWAREIERRVTNAHAVVVLLSAVSINSEMLVHEVQIAHESAQKTGKPRILPIRINFDGPLPSPLGAILDGIQYTQWKGPQDNQSLVAEITESLAGPKRSASRKIPLEAVGGAVPIDSRFYIQRPTDEEFHQALERRDSIILIKGARQMGKSSLMARGMQEARKAGAKVILTDFQKLNNSHLESVEKLLLALAEWIADQLEIDVVPADVWSPRRGPSMNFERFLRREILAKLSAPLVWGMDEVDRLFSCSYGSEVFGLFRSWHNERSLDPSGPWQNLTLAIAYATEAHMFITDMNQSPFNVGTRLVLADFTPAQVAELNQRYGSPLHDKAELDQFYDLVGGQPYLTRRGLHELTSNNLAFADFSVQAARDEGPYGDHLRRLLVSLAGDNTLCNSVREMMSGRQNTTSEAFYRLRSSGLVAGDSAREMKSRCKLYETYLARHLL